LPITCDTTPIGIQVQLPSQADIDKGIGVTFPMNVSSDISVQSEVPAEIISM